MPQERSITHSWLDYALDTYSSRDLSAAWLFFIGFIGFTMRFSNFYARPLCIHMRRACRIYENTNKLCFAAKGPKQRRQSWDRNKPNKKKEEKMYVYAVGTWRRPKEERERRQVFGKRYEARYWKAISKTKLKSLYSWTRRRDATPQSDMWSDYTLRYNLSSIYLPLDIKIRTCIFISLFRSRFQLENPNSIPLGINFKCNWF